MFTRSQHHRISLLAVLALLIGLVAAVPHYGHADVSHGVTKNAQSHDHSASDLASADDTTGDSVDGEVASECDHGCHLGHHFNVVLCGGQKGFTHIANQPPNSHPQKFSLLAKRRNLRPPISQIS